MNKNFPDADEDDSLITTESFGGTTPDEKELEEFAAPFSRIENEENSSESREPKTSAPDISEVREATNDPINLIDPPSTDAPINQFAAESSAYETFAEAKDETANSKFNASENDAQQNEKRADDLPIFAQSPYYSESSDETIRKSGLAYTAAIVLFASIVFTLILGWFADLLFGTSPWGKVVGIVLGAIIGFIQFFRTTSQLIKNKD